MEPEIKTVTRTSKSPGNGGFQSLKKCTPTSRRLLATLSRRNPMTNTKTKTMPGKAERMAEAKKKGVSELSLYIGYAEKFGIEPAPSAKKAWAKVEKAAAKKEGSK